jgi:hypothetical protein
MEAHTLTAMGFSSFRAAKEKATETQNGGIFT